MPMPCAVCHHESASAIDDALLEGASHREVALIYNLHPSSVYRHYKQHLLTGKTFTTREDGHVDPPLSGTLATSVRGKKKKLAAPKIKKESVAKRRVREIENQFQRSIQALPGPEEAQKEEVVEDWPPGKNRPPRASSGALAAMTPKEKVEFLAQSIYDFGIEASENNERLVAVIAMDKAATILLKAANLWKEKDVGPAEDTPDAQDKLLESIRRAQSMPAVMPYPEWEVSGTAEK